MAWPVLEPLEGQGAAASGEGQEVPMRLRPAPSGPLARSRIFRDEAIVAILDHHQGGFARWESAIPAPRLFVPTPIVARISVVSIESPAVL